MNGVRGGLLLLLLVATTVAQGRDGWQQIDDVIQRTGTSVCDLARVAGADTTRFGAVSNGQVGCRFGWGAAQANHTEVEMNDSADFRANVALVPGKYGAFFANGRMNTWGAGTAVGLTYQAGAYQWRVGTSCDGARAQCGAPTLQLRGVF